MGWPATRVMGGASYSNMKPSRALNGLWVKSGKNLVSPVIPSCYPNKLTVKDSTTSLPHTFHISSLYSHAHMGVFIGQVIFVHLCTF